MTEGVSSHYTKAVEHLEKGETLHAQVHALLYIGEQLELGHGFNTENMEKLTNALKGRTG